MTVQLTFNTTLSIIPATFISVGMKRARKHNYFYFIVELFILPLTFFHDTSGSLYSLFPKSLRHEKLFFQSFNMAKPATFFANFPVNKYPSTSKVIRRYRSTDEGCALVPLVTSSIGDSELIIHFQEAYARLFPNFYNKQGIQSNLHSYTPMNQGTICAKVYPEGIQPIKGNNSSVFIIFSSHSGTFLLRELKKEK